MIKLKIPLLGLATLFSVGLTVSAHASVGDGFFVHNSSGSCMNPKNKAFSTTESTQVLLKSDCPFKKRQTFSWLVDGKIQHTASGRCIRPEGALNNVQPFSRLKLTTKCNGNKLGFAQLNNGAIVHVKSGLCIHPESGKDSPPNGTRLILKSNCKKSFTQFDFVEGQGIGDEDNDGVTDDIDQCPGTPAGSQVDETGCVIPPPPPVDDDLDRIQNTNDSCPQNAGPLVLNGCPGFFGDFDNDGISDEIDLCPFTAPKDEVIDEGCSSIDFEDDDFDGIFNGSDLCPNTQGFSGRPDQFGCTTEQMRDEDRDGIFDSIDLCPSVMGDTNLNGCSLNPGDNDSDGVLDEEDKCPFTTELGRNFVNSAGCADIFEFQDDDGDSVMNIEDSCPNTPRFAIVDFSGCSSLLGGGDNSDSDGDGVPDTADECPNTPTGIPVDGVGCPIDDDQDGVPNHLDLCPNTPLGAEVDRDGCEFSPAIQILDQNKIIVEGTDLFSVSIDDLILNRPFGPGMILLMGPSNEVTLISTSDTQSELRINDPFFSGIIEFEIAIIDQTNNDFSNIFLLRIDVIGMDGNGDNDDDGVPNALDECPNTPPGTEVDASGCDINAVIQILGQNTFVVEGTDLFTISFEDLRLDKPFSSSMHLNVGRSNQAELINTNPTHSDFRLFDPFFSGTIQLEVFIIDTRNGNRSNPFFFNVEVIGQVIEENHSAVIVNDGASLDASRITLLEVFDTLTREGDAEMDGVDLFQQFWDAQLTESAIGSPINCVEINGFPIQCDRQEAQIALNPREEIEDEISQYKLLAAVNRIELRDGWNDCGEHRLVFGLDRGFEDRNFIIFEARVPNPIPGEIGGCEGVIAFWDIMSSLDPSRDSIRRGDLIRAFYMEASFTNTPVLSIANFSAEKGQVRTNQFITKEWLLREYELAMDCEESCKVVALPVRVAENPFGPLFNATLADSGEGTIAEAAVAFQKSFPSNLEGLLSNDFLIMSNKVEDQFNSGQSHSQFPGAFDNNFLEHFFEGGGEGSVFGQDLFESIDGRTDALGNQLTVEQLLARATALTCGGCHEPREFGLTQPNSIGAIRLPNGTIRDSWPETLGFVHIDENRQLSPALREVFLPVRLNNFNAVLDELSGGFSSSSSSSSSSSTSTSSTSTSSSSSSSTSSTSSGGFGGGF